MSRHTPTLVATDVALSKHADVLLLAIGDAEDRGDNEVFVLTPGDAMRLWMQLGRAVDALLARQRSTETAGYLKVEGDVTFNPAGGPYFTGDARVVEERELTDAEPRAPWEGFDEPS